MVRAARGWDVVAGGFGRVCRRGCRLADAVAAVIDTVRACTLAANSAPGAGASARAARSASRMRGLLRSTPPTRVAPNRTPVGSSSRGCRRRGIRCPRNIWSIRSRSATTRSSSTRSEMSSGCIWTRVRHEALMPRAEVRGLRRRTCRSRDGEAGGSLSREVPGGVGAAPTKPGRVGTAR